MGVAGHRPLADAARRKLSDAERERRAKVAAWKKAVRAAEAAGKRPPRQPRGLSLDPLPSAPAVRRRRRDADGHELPARRTPSARSAEARNRWHVAADWVEMYAPVLWQPLHERLLAAEAAEHARRAAMTDAERAADGRPQVLLLDDTPVNSRAAFDGRATLRSRREYFVLGAATIDWPARHDRRAAAGPGRPAHPAAAAARLPVQRGHRLAAALRRARLHPGRAGAGVHPGRRRHRPAQGHRRLLPDGGARAVAVPHPRGAHRGAGRADAGRGRAHRPGKALRPELAAHLSWLTGERLRSITDAQWSAWWDDFETLLDRLDLPPEKLAERRDSYEPAVAAALPALRANPGVPVSTGGFETLLRTTVKTVLTGRGHGVRQHRADEQPLRPGGVPQPRSVRPAQRASSPSCARTRRSTTAGRPRRATWPTRSRRRRRRTPRFGTRT